MSDTIKLIARLRAEAAEAREAGATDMDDLFTEAAGQIEQLVAWRPAASAPRDASGLAVICRLRCCHPGGLFVTVADPMNGEWMANIGHSIDIEMWRPLPGIPAILKAEGGVQ